MEALRRLSRRLRVVEHAVGVGLFILTTVLFCFVCWEYRVAFPVWKTGSMVVRGGQVSATSAVAGGGAAQDADLSAASVGGRAVQDADLSAASVGGRAAQHAELSGGAAQDAELSAASAGGRAAQHAELSGGAAQDVELSAGGRAAQDAELSAGVRAAQYADFSATSAGDRAQQNADCDWSEGNWVWDESYPLYESRDCPFMDGGFHCSDNGRPDRSYTMWRWQPSHCNLPRFDAKTMLEKLRNRRLVFVGDSIGRNQWESLLCMLSSAFPNKTSIYEVNGRPISKHDGFFVYMFKDYNCTVEYYRAPFLVVQGRAPHGAPKKVKRTLRLDVLDWTSKRWRDADILIFNTGHWWNSGKTINGGSFFQEGVKVKMEMSVESAYERAIKTLFDWIHKEVNRRKTQVIFRSYAPVHFRSGDWKTGGSCHLETLPELGSSPLSLEPWANLLHPFMNISKDRSLDAPTPELDLLNVTQLTARRKDGHLSLYYLGPSKTAPLHRQDCSHWCLPGVPDVWNELVYALTLKRDTIINQTSLPRVTTD